MLKHIEIAEPLRDRLFSSSQWLVAAAAGDAKALPLIPPARSGEARLVLRIRRQRKQGLLLRLRDPTGKQP